ncbi:hypothetical protein AWENTII_009061 [Aspergillus wentii]
MCELRRYTSSFSPVASTSNARIERRRALDRKTVPGCYHHKDRPKNNRGKRKIYPCCHQRRGCVVLDAHKYLPVPEGQAEMWRCSKLTPAQDGVKTARAAVSMDCEMVEVEGGSSEVAQVCAVDIVTGEVLVDTFVVPKKKVTDWRTPWSGMSEKRLRQMVSAGRTVNGWEEAREELWKYVDENTLMVGQALKHDLEVMRMVHLRVIDTAIVSREAVGKSCKDSFGLKTLCSDILNRDIQPAQVGHDCMEDTMATREVVLCWVQNPEKVHEWAENLRLKSEQSRKNKARKKEEKRAQRNI